MKTIFENKIETRVYNPTASELDRLGKDGWQLVAVVPEHDGAFTRYFFKRERQVPA